MNITFVGGLGHSGGSRVIANLANGLVQRGHLINVISFEEKNNYFLKANIRTRTIKYTLPPFFLLKPFTFSANILNLARIIPESDITVSTFNWTAYSTLLGGKGSLFYYVQCYEPLMAQNDPLFKAIAETTYYFPNHLMANSTYVQKCLRQKFRKESDLLSPGVDTITFYPRIKRNKDQKRKRILWLGTSAPWKGFCDAYQAIKLISKERGDIQFVTNFLPSIVSNDMAIENMGYISTDEKLANLYSSCDAFIFTSWFEGFGLPPLESMACGLPVVTTDCGGINDYAKNRINALIVPPKNPKAIASSVLELLSNDDLYHRIREQGLRTAKLFTWAKTVDTAEKVFSRYVK